MPPTKKKKTTPKHGSSGGSDDEDYRKKRDRNNQAVKRSRVKSKQRTNQTKDRVDALKSQNEKLEERISQKQNQLKTLKELFLETASKKSETGSSNYNLQKLLADSDDETPGGSRA